MRRAIVIVVGIIVAASCVPWLRRQHYFGLIVGITVYALVGVMVFRGIVFCKQKWQSRGKVDSVTDGRQARRYRFWAVQGVIFLSLIVVLPHFMATSSGAYKLAIATANQAPQFTKVLGAPIREGWYSEGKVGGGPPAKADLLIPVQGRVRNGNLRVVAIEEGWELAIEALDPGTFTARRKY